MNNKGFTLVELLGSMVILGLLMLLVVPNIVGMLNSSREGVYVDDCKKLIVAAQSKASMKKFKLPSEANHCILLGLGYLDNSEFDNPPNGGCYDVNRSFVVIKRTGDTFEYMTQLVEFHDDKFEGIITPKTEASLDRTAVTDGLPDVSFDYRYDIESIDGVPGCSDFDTILLKNGAKEYSEDGEAGICAK